MSSRVQWPNHLGEIDLQKFRPLNVDVFEHSSKNTYEDRIHLEKEQVQERVDNATLPTRRHDNCRSRLLRDVNSDGVSEGSSDRRRAADNGDDRVEKDEGEKDGDESVVEFGVLGPGNRVSRPPCIRRS